MLFSRYHDLIFSWSRHNKSCFLVITTSFSRNHDITKVVFDLTNNVWTYLLKTQFFIIICTFSWISLRNFVPSLKKCSSTARAGKCVLCYIFTLFCIFSASIIYILSLLLKITCFFLKFFLIHETFMKYLNF